MSNMDERTEMSANSPAAGRDRIMEILVFLLSEMRAQKGLTEIDLVPLSQRGFSQTEISAAFSWLFDKLAAEQSAPEGPIVFAAPFAHRAGVSHRVYHEVERSVIGSSAQGYLMQMHELGLVSDFDLEFVIDRIMMSGVPSVSIDEVRELVSGTVLGFEDMPKAHSRVMLSASDRIQ
jgi:uncharacterized protein Smg (DUF494 family)